MTTSTEDTRRTWHGIAELVLAGPQFRETGTIRLRVTPGGFATTKRPDLRVDRGDLVSVDRRVAIAGRTCRELAEAVGVTAGAPEDLYSDGCSVTADETLALDAAMAEHLAASLRIGDAALRRLAPDQTPVLWPEHFDAGVSIDEVNYGISLGDSFLAEPYAYVGPWQPRQGVFWNAPFGAALPLRDLEDVEAIVAFFIAGRDHAWLNNAAAPSTGDTTPTTSTAGKP
jgi:hypothetical protein